MTNAMLTLNEGVAYTITVIAVSLKENATSEAFCIQLSSKLPQLYPHRSLHVYVLNLLVLYMCECVYSRSNKAPFSV